MKHHYLLLAACCAGCLPTDMLPGVADAPRARSCAEEAVVVVDDVTEAAPGFSFAVAPVQHAVRRLFTGQVTRVDGRVTQGALDMRGAGREVRAVYPAGSIDGQLDAACPPYYEVDMGATLSDDEAWLSETFSARLVMTGEERASLSVRLPGSEVRGALGTHEADLVVDGAYDGECWQGALAWEREGVQQALGSFDFR